MDNFEIQRAEKIAEAKRFSKSLGIAAEVFPMFGTNSAVVCGLFESRGLKSPPTAEAPYWTHQGLFYDPILGRDTVLICEGRIGDSTGEKLSRDYEAYVCIQNTCLAIDKVQAPVRTDNTDNRLRYSILENCNR